MENESKLQPECMNEEYMGNNNKLIKIEESSPEPKECDNRISNLTYRIIDTTDAIGKGDFYFPINIKNCKFIPKNKGTMSKMHRAIAPKLMEVNRVSVKKNICLESKLRKDDKRRETHNEVERRRRTKINNCIFKLKELIPDEEVAITSAELSKTSSADSKSQILIRAYDYIQQLQEELKSLRECIKENDLLRLSNQELHRQINELQSGASQEKA